MIRSLGSRSGRLRRRRGGRFAVAIPVDGGGAGGMAGEGPLSEFLGYAKDGHALGLAGVAQKMDIDGVEEEVLVAGGVPVDKNEFTASANVSLTSVRRL